MTMNEFEKNNIIRSNYTMHEGVEFKSQRLKKSETFCLLNAFLDC